nr:hypothetical protein P5626_05675 [Bacillus subtilis]
MKIYSTVFIGGALGACLRYGLNLWIHTGQFPAATYGWKMRQAAFY